MRAYYLPGVGLIISSHSKNSLKEVLSPFDRSRNCRDQKLQSLAKSHIASKCESNPGLNPKLMLLHLHHVIFKANIYTNFTKHFHIDFFHLTIVL